MTYTEAKRIFKDSGGTDHRGICKRRSYQRGGAWHLLSISGELRGVILPGGRCIRGNELNAAWRQFMMGQAG